MDLVKVFDRAIDRRTLLAAGAAGGILTLAPLGRVAVGETRAAHEGTPEASDTLGYPAVTVTIDQTGLTTPEPFPAGLTYVTVVNEDIAEGEHMIWLLVPDGMTRDEIMASMTQDEDPSWLVESAMVGGPDWAFPGKDAEGIVDFSPGLYVLMNVFGPQVGFLEVTEPDDDAGPEAPEADVTVRLVDHAFEGLDQPVPAGRTIWEFANVGETFHEIVLLAVEPGVTEEMVVAGFGDESLTWEPVAGTSLLTGGKTAWGIYDLSPGDYAAICAVPDNFDGPPHVMLGMVKIITVE